MKASFREWWEDFKAGRECARFLAVYLVFTGLIIWFSI